MERNKGRRETWPALLISHCASAVFGSVLFDMYLFLVVDPHRTRTAPAWIISHFNFRSSIFRLRLFLFRAEREIKIYARICCVAIVCRFLCISGSFSYLEFLNGSINHIYANLYKHQLLRVDVARRLHLVTFYFTFLLTRKRVMRTQVECVKCK